jgi:hypothetical protein
VPQRRVAFLSMDSLEQFVCYDYLVREMLIQRSIDVQEVPWRSASVDWNVFDLVVIRSPWDYQQAPSEFLAVLDQIESSSATLLNSIATVRWNMRKTYLKDIEAAGGTIVPTKWLESPTVDQLKNLFEDLQSEQIVVKPVVGANADHAYWLRPASDYQTFDAAAKVFQSSIALAQPFVESIQSFGEVSLIFFEETFSHAVLKTPKADDFRVQEEHGGVIQRWQPDQTLIAFAQKCLSACPEKTLYSRVDIVFLSDNQPAVMEIELIEPSLYLTYCEESAERFADAIVRTMQCS